MITARDIQRALILPRYRQSTVMPNYTPRGWWECDVFELTKAEMFVEYEIKLSRADFRADRNKGEVLCYVRIRWFDLYSPHSPLL